MGLDHLRRARAEADQTSVARRDQLTPDSPSQGILERLKGDWKSLNTPRGRKFLAHALELTPMPVAGGIAMGDDAIRGLMKSAFKQPPNISMHPSNRVKDVLKNIMTKGKSVESVEKEVGKVAPTSKHSQFWIAQQLVSKARAGKATPEEMRWLLLHGYGI